MAMWPEEYEGLRAEAREAAAALSAALGADPDPAPGATAPDHVSVRARIAALEVTSPAGRDEVIAGVPCRVFQPQGRSRGTYLHFHGGGMYVGSPRMNDRDNAELCEQLDVRVVSVDYRLAPEHPYPAGFDDAFAVARWVLEDEPRAIVVGGESSGAQISSVTLARVRDELDALDRFAAANLVYGVYDMSGTPSHRGVRPSDVPDTLHGGTADTVRERFLPGWSREDARAPAVSPLFADLRGMPPALFTVGFADHLLDDTLFMAARWAAFGARAELAVYPDCAHGFLTFPIELTKRAFARIRAFLDGVYS